MLVTGTCTVDHNCGQAEMSDFFQAHVNWFLISCSCSGVGFTRLEGVRHPGCEPSQVWEQQSEVHSFSSGKEKRTASQNRLFSFAGTSYPQNYIRFVLNFNCSCKTKL